MRDKHNVAFAFIDEIHTTDQLNQEQDEFIPREYDSAGEAKVNAQGFPLGGRQFKIRTFHVAHRGEKRFMLATECARVLGYRDSYLLFNKNRSLHKIIATPQEKDDLISQEILPYSYRSRQISLVTAKSIFRGFGARVIQGGRRVRDDYWEAKAIKLGFTEDDMPRNNQFTVKGKMDSSSAENPPAGKNKALQDYHMQLRLLEQQHKKRRLMALQEQDTISGSRSAPTEPKLSDLP